MLLDLPLPDVEEERKQEEIPIGEPIVPPPPNLDFLPFSRPFYLKNFSLGPQNQEDPVREVAAMPHVEASLVVGASTFAVLWGVPRHRWIGLSLHRKTCILCKFA